MEIAIVLILGYIFDLILGDPTWIPHPVVLIGRLISLCEKVFRNLFSKDNRGEFLGGICTLVVVAVISFLVPFALIKLAKSISPWIGYGLEVLWCWQILAGKSLAKAARDVMEPLKAGDLQEARVKLSYIVGRDTEGLSQEEVIKATVETVAENTSDGIIGPMIFMAVGGVPLGFLYKAVNTLDSMVGYKNEKYLYFGRASAKMDDVFNFIPSRLTALVMCIVSGFMGLDRKGAFRIWKRDGKKHLSPNSGNPESACAGALGVELGGNAYYFGKFYEKASLGDPLRPIEVRDIERVNKLMYLTNLFTLVSIEVILFIKYVVF